MQHVCLDQGRSAFFPEGQIRELRVGDLAEVFFSASLQAFFQIGFNLLELMCAKQILLTDREPTI